MSNYANAASPYGSIAQQAAAQAQAAAYNNNALQVAQPQTHLETFEITMREVLQYLDGQGDKIEMLYAKLNGGLGAAAGSTGTQNKPQPSGHVAIMTEMFEQIGARLKRTDAVLDQLRSII